MPLELHYSDGGHGGPHPHIHAAYEYASRYLQGTTAASGAVEVRYGVSGPLVARVIKRTDPDAVRPVVLFRWAPGMACECGWGALCECDPYQQGWKERRVLHP